MKNLTTKQKSFQSLKKRKTKITKKLIIKSTCIISFLAMSFTLFFITTNLYHKIKCQSLTYSTNYFLTKDDTPLALLKVKKSSPIFLNNKKAIIKAYGLSKSKPHKRTTLECHFEKDSFDSWKLVDISTIENTN